MKRKLSREYYCRIIDGNASGLCHYLPYGTSQYNKLKLIINDLELLSLCDDSPFLIEDIYEENETDVYKANTLRLMILDYLENLE